MSAVNSSTLAKTFNNTEFDIDTVLDAARSGDENALNFLIQHYEPEVRKIASKFFLQRADYEDLIQEGRIAIYKAIISYDLNGGIPFLHFVRMVIKRKIIDILRSHNRNKHNNFNEAYSLDTSLSENNEVTFLDLMPDLNDPESMLVALEEAKGLVKDISERLSELERLVFKHYYLGGLKQREVSKKLGLPLKTLDNAIQRIRRKTLNYKSEKAAG